MIFHDPGPQVGAVNRPDPFLKDNREDHEGPFAWYEKEDPCSVAGNFELLGCDNGGDSPALALFCSHLKHRNRPDLE